MFLAWRKLFVLRALRAKRLRKLEQDVPNASRRWNAIIDYIRRRNSVFYIEITTTFIELRSFGIRFALERHNVFFTQHDWSRSWYWKSPDVD